VKRTKENRLLSKACLEEMVAVSSLASRPMTRKVWLFARRWYRFHKERLDSIGYSGKIPRFPKHVEKKEKIIKE
jgi:hypothetical protein